MKVQLTITHEGKKYGGEVELTTTGSSERTPRAREQVSQQVVPTKPSQAIEQLYQKGFFKARRTLTDTLEELVKRDCNFGSSSVLMALQRASFIQQKGRKGSYTFVQKHPPIAGAD